MAGGFLNRWSRLKAGEQPELEKKSDEVIKVDSVNAPAPAAAPELPDAVPLSLGDVEKIDRLAPDFSAFMKPGVDPAVQQAAMKKMFSDPHFNVMDGLDIYIDDYSKPDPIPLEMLKRMVQSDMLNIFRKDPVEGGEVEKAVGIQSTEPIQATLPPVDETDLTSTHLAPREELIDTKPVPMDKKTS